MDEATIKSMAAELAKGLKTPEDLNQMTAVFKKFMIETALNTELSDHLGYEKHQPKKGSNSRNGFSSKTITTQDGQLALDIPRDREGSFEPQIIKKHQTRITSMDDQILSLYAKGMTNREIVAFFKEMYDADVSASLISKVTDAVIEQVTEWQNRALDSLYPVVYLDCIVVKVRQHSNVINGTVAKLAMRQPFVLFKGLTFQKLCLPGAFRPGDHHNKMLRPGLCVVHASPQYL